MTLTIPVDLVGAEGKRSPDGKTSLIADAFRIMPTDVSGLGDNTAGCWGTPNKPIVIKLTGPGTAKANFDSAFGPERYDCEIILQRQGAGEPVG